MKPRATILSNIRLRIEDQFSIKAADPAQRWFRDVWRRPWRPLNPLRPACTIVDVGQVNNEQTDEDVSSRTRTLSYHLVIDLAENWDRQTLSEDWSDRVELIHVSLENWLKAGPGLISHKYLNDDPLEVLLKSGQTESVWIVQMEAQYFINVGLPDKS